MSATRHLCASVCIRGLIALLLTCPAAPEIIDRVAANISRSVILDSEVVEEARVEAFIQGAEPDLTAANKRKILDRLIDQFLIRRELEFTRFAPASDQDIEPLLKQITDRNRDYARYRITPELLKKHVAWTLNMLRFVEYRFAPAIQISPAEIEREYRRRLPEWKDKAPPLDEIRPELEKLLIQSHVDAALDRWLGEMRTQNDIVYHEGYK